MKILIVHAHPEPRSFNGALTDLARRCLPAAGHELVVSDLYALGWDPRSDRSNFTAALDPNYFKQQQEEEHASATGGFALDVQAELDKLFWCDALVFQFPLWWFSLPAMLKGWVDRVFAMGAVYGGGVWYDRGRFEGRRAMLSLTVGGPATMYGPDGLNGDIHQLLYPIQHGMLRFTGFDVLPPFIAWQPARIGEKARRACLEQYRQRLLTLATTEPLRFPSLDAYDPATYALKPTAAA
jgi:NAD(P)H dehydrogenase (quinone)